MSEFPRGNVTFLFTDIQGSTQLLYRLGEAYASVLATQRQLLRAAFERHGGHEVDTQGDSFFVAFADSRAAISAAADAQRALQSYSWPENVEVRVRMGLHQGQPICTSEGYVGVDVHHGARLMAAGHGGQVLLSETMRDVKDADFPSGTARRQLGRHHLKDIMGPEPIDQLVIDGLESHFPPLKTIDLRPNNLPSPLTVLVGRNAEVAAAQEILRRPEVRLLTLTGIGGTGKTRLALQIALGVLGEFEDGAFFIDLAPVSDPDLVVANIAQTLAVREATNQPLLATLKENLHDRQLFLLLDNFEQVVSAAPIVAELLEACPRLKVLVTSRIKLNLRAEHEFLVPPLALPDLQQLPCLQTLRQIAAVALFIQRAQMIKPDFELDERNATLVAAICTRTDGLPLAIALAAARVKVLSLRAMIARMNHSLQLLTGGGSDLPARHQTLHNTIAWSYDLLSESEKTLFRRIAVFQGGCTLEAIGALGDDAEDVFEGVSSLCDKSLLRQCEDSSGEIRFSMFETIREFGVEKLGESGAAEALRQKHAAWFLDLSQRAFLAFEAENETFWLRQLENEADNFRAVFDWCAARDDEASRGLELQLAGTLWWLWLRRGQWSEGCARLKSVLSHQMTVHPAEVAASDTHSDTHREALAWAHFGAGILTYRNAKRDMARAHFKAALELWPEARIVQRARTLNWLGIAHMREAPGARAYFERALETARLANDADTLGRVIHNFGVLAYEQRDFEAARAQFEAALTLDESLGRDGAYTRIRLGDIALWEGQFERAAAHYQRVLDAQKPEADTFLRAYTLDSLGNAARLQGDWPRARACYEESGELFRKMGSRHNIAASLHALAHVALAQNQPERARELLQRSWEHIKDPVPLNEVMRVLGFAALQLFSGDVTLAARTLGAAEVAAAALENPLEVVDHLDAAHMKARARELLGASAFEQAFEQGRAISLAAALAEFALEAAKNG